MGMHLGRLLVLWVAVVTAAFAASSPFANAAGTTPQPAPAKATSTTPEPDLLTTASGGVIEKVSGEAGPGFQGRLLNDGDGDALQRSLAAATFATHTAYSTRPGTPSPKALRTVPQPNSNPATTKSSSTPVANS